MTSHAITFDTLKFVETLKASGFDDTQAKGMATAIREVQTTQLDDVVTKRELKEMESQLATKADTAKIEMRLTGVETQLVELKRGIKELELRMVIRTGGMILAGVGIMFGLLRVWPLTVQYLPPPPMQTMMTAPAVPTPAIR